ncbi:13142_t:CDS:1, partial [Ambispora gerdemannii]
PYSNNMSNKTNKNTKNSSPTALDQVAKFLDISLPTPENTKMSNPDNISSNHSDTLSEFKQGNTDHKHAHPYKRIQKP